MAEKLSAADLSKAKEAIEILGQFVSTASTSSGSGASQSQSTNGM